MPRLIDQPMLQHSLTLAVRNVLVLQGVPGLTLRAVAREARVSPSCLLHHYGNARRAIEVATLVFARERVETMRQRVAMRGVEGLLPMFPDDLVDARAWQGWLELGRTRDDLGRIVAGARRWERSLVRDALDHRVDGLELDALVAVVDGLQTAMSLPDRPLPLPRAHEVLAQACRALLTVAPPGRLDEDARWLVRTSPVRI